MSFTERRPARREYIWLVVVAAVLVTSVWSVRAHADTIRIFIDDHPVSGVVLYVALNIVDAVAAPGATLPLIPVAAHAWGRLPAALITTVGWTSGSLIAFLIARVWGVPLVRKLTSMRQIKRLKPYIPNNLFWSVVILRTVLPMDVISYVLGLFTNMRWSSYSMATALGLTPSAVILTYLGKTPHAYEVITIVIACAAAAAIVFSARQAGRRTEAPRFRVHTHSAHSTRRHALPLKR